MYLFSLYNKVFLFGVFGKKNRVSVLSDDFGVFCRIVILGLDCHNAFLRFSVHSSNLVEEVFFILISDVRTKRRAISPLQLSVAILRQEQPRQSQLASNPTGVQLTVPIPKGRKARLREKTGSLQ